MKPLKALVLLAWILLAVCISTIVYVLISSYLKKALADREAAVLERNLTVPHGIQRLLESGTITRDVAEALENVTGSKDYFFTARIDSTTYQPLGPQTLVTIAVKSGSYEKELTFFFVDGVCGAVSTDY